MPGADHCSTASAAEATRSRPGVALDVDVDTGRQVGVKIVDDSLSLTGNDGLRWTQDGTAVWIQGEGVGVVRLQADPDGWREIACGIVHRELSADEWRTHVSETEPQVAACGR